MRKYRCISPTDEHKIGDVCIVEEYEAKEKFDSKHFQLIQVGLPEEKTWFGQGMIYKNWEAYDSSLDMVCYIPELSDATYTRQDFIDFCRGNEELAKELFLSVDWQHPETLIEDWKVNEEVRECEQCGWLFECYEETRCPNCGAEWKGDD